MTLQELLHPQVLLSAVTTLVRVPIFAYRRRLRELCVALLSRVRLVLVPVGLVWFEWLLDPLLRHPHTLRHWYFSSRVGHPTKPVFPPELSLGAGLTRHRPRVVLYRAA